MKKTFTESTAAMTDFNRGLLAIALIISSVALFTFEVMWLRHVISHFHGSAVPLFTCILVVIATDFFPIKALRSVLIASLVFAQCVIWFPIA